MKCDDICEHELFKFPSTLAYDNVSLHSSNTKSRCLKASSSGSLRICSRVIFMYRSRIVRNADRWDLLNINLANNFFIFLILQMYNDP